MSPRLLLLILIMLGGVAYVPLKREFRKNTATDRVPNSRTLSALELAGATNTSEVSILQSQVSYLEEQLQFTKEENQRLRKSNQVLQTNQKELITDPVLLLSEAEKIRQLTAKGEITFEEKKSEELLAQVRKSLIKHVGESSLEKLSLAYQVLGFYDLPVDLLVALAETQLEANAGILSDNFEKISFFQEDSNTQQRINRSIAQIVQAIVNQHHPKRSPWIPNLSSIDHQLAHLALMQGESGLIQFILSQKKQTTKSDQVYREYYKAPAFLRDQMIKFPTKAGTNFLLEKHQKTGWEGINQIHQNPPQYTAQILHPELYDQPEWKPFIPSSNNWDIAKKPNLLLNAVMGELNIGLLLKRYLPKKQAREASMGWFGDRLVVQGESLETASYRWEIRFINQEEASQAFEAFNKAIQHRHNLSQKKEETLERTTINYQYLIQKESHHLTIQQKENILHIISNHQKN